MNALGIKITDGERVIAESGRIFVCNGIGGGAETWKLGATLFGAFEDAPSEECRINGMTIKGLAPKKQEAT